MNKQREKEREQEDVGVQDNFAIIIAVRDEKEGQAESGEGEAFQENYINAGRKREKAV